MLIVIYFLHKSYSLSNIVCIIYISSHRYVTLLRMRRVVSLKITVYNIEGVIFFGIHNNGIGCINVISCIHIKYSLDRRVLAIAQVCVLLFFVDAYWAISLLYTSSHRMVRLYVPLLWCSHHRVYAICCCVSCLYSFGWVLMCNTSSSVPFCHFRRVKILLRCKNIICELNFGVPESIFIFSLLSLFWNCVPVCLSSIFVYFCSISSVNVHLNECVFRLIKSQVTEMECDKCGVWVHELKVQNDIHPDCKWIFFQHVTWMEVSVEWKYRIFVCVLDYKYLRNAEGEMKWKFSVNAASSPEMSHVWMSIFR